jgi:hypothetical protein
MRRLKHIKKGTYPHTVDECAVHLTKIGNHTQFDPERQKKKPPVAPSGLSIFWRFRNPVGWGAETSDLVTGAL